MQAKRTLRGRTIFTADYLDDNGALSELNLAGQTLPNDSRLFELKGYVERRRPGANEEDALPDLHRAVELDPRNVSLLQQTAITYRDLRRYAEEQAIVDRILAIEPNDVERRTWRAFVDLNWKADTKPLHQLIDSVRATTPDALPRIAEEWLICALAEHDAAAAASALTILGENRLGNELIKYSRHFVEGLIARMAKDDVKAHAAFDAARAEQEKLVGAHPDDAGALCVLGLIDAALGRKEEALREGRRAVELLPIEKDPRQGPRVLVCFGNDRRLGRRQQSRVRPTRQRHALFHLSAVWSAQAAAVLGPAARRPMLRKNRRLPGAKVILLVINWSEFVKFVSYGQRN